ncbi:MAG: hypothetical protein IIC80_12605, partial [Chloroflexi bacterium]|nr:hypothetical protein [Chloroflexota bacterium]
MDQTTRDALLAMYDVPDPAHPGRVIPGYDKEHAERTTRIVLRVAEAVGLDGRRLADLEITTLLHDLGRTGMDPELFGAVFGLLMLCYFFLPFYRRMGVYTLSEYLGRRFDERSRLLYSITNMAFLLIQMVGTLILGALTLETLTAGSDFAISYEQSVWLLASVAAAYTIVGGLKAVIYTDF